MAEKQIAEMKAMLASMSTENEDQPKPQTTENQQNTPQQRPPEKQPVSQKDPSASKQNSSNSAQASQPKATEKTAEAQPPKQDEKPKEDTAAEKKGTPSEAGSADTSEGEEGQETIIGKQGYFDGIFMISDGDEKKYQLPPNYVSKSMLVIGDRLEIVEVDETGSRYSFKQLDHVERKEIEGILTKKDNQWAVHTQDGIYYVVAAAVKYYGGEIGDKAIVIVPAQDVPVENIEWAALKELHKIDESKGLIPQTPKPQPNYNQQKQQSQPQQPKKQTPAVQQTPVSPAQGTNNAPPQQAPAANVTPNFDQQIPLAPATTPQAPSEKTGEVTVSHEPQSGDSVGEVDLTDEQLWELR